MIYEDRPLRTIVRVREIGTKALKKFYEGHEIPEKFATSTENFIGCDENGSYHSDYELNNCFTKEELLELEPTLDVRVVRAGVVLMTR